MHGHDVNLSSRVPTNDVYLSSRVPVSGRLGEERVDEELRKHIQSTLEVRVRHVEVEVRVEHVRVLLATVVGGGWMHLVAFCVMPCMCRLFNNRTEQSIWSATKRNVSANFHVWHILSATTDDM